VKKKTTAKSKAKPKAKKLKKMSAAQLKKAKGGAAYTSVKNVPTGYSGWSPTNVSYRSGSSGSTSGRNRARAGR
jgi:hypothetical protein